MLLYVKNVSAFEIRFLMDEKIIMEEIVLLCKAGFKRNHQFNFTKTQFRSKSGPWTFFPNVSGRWLNLSAFVRLNCTELKM